MTKPKTRSSAHKAAICRASAKTSSKASSKVPSKAPYVLLLLLIVLAALMLNIGTVKNTLTGMVVREQVVTYVDPVSQAFATTTNYHWQPAHAGELRAVSLSGLITGNGTVKVYLGASLILDSKKLAADSESATQGMTAVTANAPDATDADESANASSNTTENPSSGSLEAQNLPDTPDSAQATTLRFDETCLDTCALSLQQSDGYDLIVELNDATLRIDNITYTIMERNEVTNSPPEYVGNTSIILTIDTPKKIQISQLFSDPDNDPITLVAVGDENISSIVDYQQITLTPSPGFAGQATLRLYASDGVETVQSPEIIVQVVENASQPPPPKQPTSSGSSGEIAPSNLAEQTNQTVNTTGQNPAEWENLTLPSNLTPENITPFNITQENLTLENTTLLNITQIIATNISQEPPSPVNITVIDLATAERVEIGKPVRWIKRISVENLNNDTAEINITVDLPPYADNISVTDSINEREIRKDAITLTSSGKTLMDIELERAPPDVPAITAQVVSVVGGNGIITRLLSWLFGSGITGYVTLDEPAPLTQARPKDIAFTDQLAVHETKEYVVEYDTAPPEITEERHGTTTQVTVYSDVNYTDILTHATINDASATRLRLYWYASRNDYATYILDDPSRADTLEQDSYKVDITHNPIFGVSLADDNSDGLVDRVEWLTPHLSNQTFEITITVLNPVTYLRDGDTWVVAFNTTGTANLTISSPNAGWTEFLTDNPDTSDEMRYINLTCGDTSLNDRLHLVSFDNTMYTYASLSASDSIDIQQLQIEDYECNDTGYLSNNMYVAGYATLRFDFGDETAYAYDPQWLNSSVPIITPSAPNKTSNLTCNATPTGNTTITVEWWWYNSTTVKFSGNTTGIANNTNTLIATLGSGNLTHFDIWNCTVRAKNGTTFSNFSSTKVNVSNILPTQDTPYITPNPANTTSNLTCNWNNTQDADDDAVQNITAWYKNNQSLMMLYMPFEGGSNSTYTKDYSGKGNNGNVSGATWNRTGGKVGGAYWFDGLDDQIILNDSPSLSITTEISLEFWVYHNSSQTSSWPFIISKGNAVNDSYEAGEDASAGRYNLGLTTPEGYIYAFCETYTIVNNTWQHYAMTIKNGASSCYLNGRLNLTYSPTFTTINATAGKLYVGRRYSGSYPFKGSLDEIRLYNRSISADQIWQDYLAGNASRSANFLADDETALNQSWKCEVTPNDGYSDGTTINSTQVQIASNAPPTQGTPYITPNPANTTSNLTCNTNNTQDVNGDPVTNITTWYKNNVSMMALYLPFEGGSNTSYSKDYSGYGYNSNVNGATWSNVGGQVGGAYSFDGIDDYMNLGNTLLFSSAQTYTISVWSKINSFQAWNFFVARQATTFYRQDYAISMKNSTTISYSYDDLTDGPFFTNWTISAIQTNTWHNIVAVVFPNNSVTMYFDGLSLGNKAGNHSDFTSTEFDIGRGYNVGTVGPFVYFNGTIDEVRIYNRTLSAAQIYQEYLMSNLSRSVNILVDDELLRNDTWKCEVTPNDGYSDGTTLNSTAVTIQNSPPTQDTPTITGETPYYPSNLTCVATNIQDIENDTVVNITRWYKDNQSYLYLYLPFEGGSNTTYTEDYSTRGNDATVYNATWSRTAGRVGGGYTFNGSCAIGAGTNVRPTNSFTFGAWVKSLNNITLFAESTSGFPAVAGQKYAFYPHWQNTEGGAGVSVGNAGIQVVEQGAAYMPVLAGYNASPTLGTGWNHIMVVYTNKQPKIYLNGTLVRTGLTSLMANVYAPYEIGGETPGGQNYGDFNGTLDEIKVFNYSLTADQVYQEYLAGKNLHSSNVLAGAETAINDQWKCEIIPNDGYVDGNAANSTTWLVTQNTAPNQGTPYITPSPASANVNITCNYNNTQDAITDVVFNITAWYRNNQSTMLLYAPFEGGSNTTYAKDYSGRNINVNVNSATFNSSGGQIGGAYRLDGTASYINYSTSGIFNWGPNNNYTFALWVKIPSGEKNGTLISQRNSTNSTPTFDIGMGYCGTGFPGDGEVCVFIRDNVGSASASVDTNQTVNDNAWHHIVVAKNQSSGNFTIYVDGVVKAKFLNPMTNQMTTDLRSIGSERRWIQDAYSSAGNRFINGTVDDVRIYNITLTPAQINADYLAGSADHDPNVLVPGTTIAGDSWKCEVTPNDGYADGNTLNSTALTIATSLAPTQGTPYITPSPANKTQNLTCTYNNTYDADNDPVQNITAWYRNNQSLMLLNMPFEGGSNDTYTEDYSGNGYNGAVRNDVTGYWNRTGGKMGGAYIFNPANSWGINISNNPVWNLQGDFSIEAWIWPDNRSCVRYAVIMAKSTSDTDSWNFRLDSTCTLSLVMGDGTAHWFGSTAKVAKNQWNHAAVVYRENQQIAYFYMNGTAAGTDTSYVGAISTISTTPYYASIGCNPEGGSCMNGTIDDVRVFAKAISADQIYQDYLASNASRSNPMLADDELLDGENWKCEVTPNDGYSDGITQNSTERYLNLTNNIPTQGTPYITPNPANKTNNITCNWNSTQDANNDFVNNITNWYLNNRSVLLAYLPFEGGSNPTVTRDYSGYGNDGNVYLAAYNRTGGRVGGGYTFDGSTTYIRIADSPSVNPANAITVSVWVRPHATAAAGKWPTIIAKGSNDQYQLATDQLTANAGAMIVTTTGSHYSSVTTSMSLNTWHYVAFTYDSVSGYYAIYENGTLMSSEYTTGTLVTTTNPLDIGGKALEYYDGNIDEVKVYNRSLSAHEIYQEYLAGNQSHPSAVMTDDELLYGDSWTCEVTPNDGYGDGTPQNSTADLIGSLNTVPTQGTPYITPSNANRSTNLTCTYNNTQDANSNAIANITVWYRYNQPSMIAYYPFETDMGNSMYDYSGNGHTGARSGATYTSSGKIGGAYTFTPNTDFIDLGDLNESTLSNRLTLEAWVYVTSFGGGVSPNEGIGYILSKSSWDDHTRSWRFETHNDSGNYTQFAVFPAGNYTDYSFVNSGTMRANTWYHLAATFNGTNLAIYINGLLNATAVAANSTIWECPTNTVIGGNENHEYGFKGTIDEVKIYNYSLSAHQIYQEYLAGFQNRSASIWVDDQLVKGENWTCEVTPSDGFGFGIAQNSSSVQVGYLPVINSAGTVPTKPYYTGTYASAFILQANVTATDGILSVNFTLTAPNGTKVINNTNGTRGGTVWNSTIATLNRYGQWNYTISAKDVDNYTANYSGSIRILQITESLNTSGNIPCNTSVRLTGHINDSQWRNASNATIRVYMNGQLVGEDLGDGSDGSLTISTPNQVVNNYTYLVANVSAGSLSLRVNSTNEFFADDEILVIQIQNASGRSAGTYEFARLSGIVGSNVTLSAPLANAYASGVFNSTSASATQVVRVPNYVHVTITSTGSITAPAWDAYEGGIIVFRASGTVNVSGIINASGKGLRGGFADDGYDIPGYPGESYQGIYTTRSLSNSLGAGGGANKAPFCGGDGAGGGGYGVAGFQGTQGNCFSTLGSPGDSYGTADASLMLMGSGGGSGAQSLNDGGTGGGIIFIVANTIALTGSVTAAGGRGEETCATHESCTNNGGGSGGGSGGLIILRAPTLTVGTALVNASGGAGGISCYDSFCYYQAGNGGFGGDGRIRLDYITLSGATQPVSGYNGSALNTPAPTNATGWYDFIFLFNASGGNVDLKVNASYGTEYGIQNLSAFVVSPPTVSSVSIYPSSADHTADLTCNATITDADPTPLTVEWFWYNGTIQKYGGNKTGVVPGVSTNITTLAAANTTRYELWNCTVRANDGVNLSAFSSANINISNAIPTQSTPTVTPNPAYKTSNLTCNWNSVSDGDNDPVTNITTWYKNNMSMMALYLPFEGGSNSTYTKDYSGNNRNATVLGAAWNRTGGRTGGAYQFNGTAGYIEVPKLSQLEEFNPYTLSAWVNIVNKSPPVYWNIPGGIVTQISAAGANGTGLLIKNTSTDYNIEYAFANSTSINTVHCNNIVRNAWHYYVGTRNATIFALYQDGVLCEQKNVIYNTSTNQALRIGRYGDNNWYIMKGTIDDVKIYNYSLSLDQIYQEFLAGNASRSANFLAEDNILVGENWKCEVTPNDGYSDGNILNSTEVSISNSPPTQLTPYITPNPANTSSNLTCNYNSTTDADGDPITNITTWYKNNQSLMVLYLPCEGGSNATFTKDYSGYGRNAIPLNASWNRTGGRIGGAYAFDGIDDSVQSVYNQTPGTDTITISAWIYTYNGTGGHSIISQDGGTTASYRSMSLIVNTQYRFAEFKRDYGLGTTGLWRTQDNSVQTNQWALIVVVYNASSVNNDALIYINGINQSFQTDTNPTGSPDISTRNWYIGRNENGTEIFNGSIDEVKIYNRSLFPDQVSQDFLAGNASRSANILADDSISAQNSWKCEVTPNDGYSDGNTLNSTEVYISGVSAPTISIPVIMPLNANVSTDLTCNATATDAENTTLTVEWFWYNGTNLKYSGNKTGVANNTNTNITTLAKANLTRFDLWNCTVRAFDGTLYSSFAGANVNISNSPPTQLTPYITPNPANKTSNLTCNTNSTNDADGDPVTNITTWYKNNRSYMLLYLPFEGGSNSTYTKDYSGYGANGSVVNALWNRTAGRTGGGYSLKGDNSYLSIGNSSRFNPTQSITISTWIYLQDYARPSKWPLLVSKGNTGPQYYTYIGASSSYVAFAVNSTTNGIVYCPATNWKNITLNTWYHVAGTYDANRGSVQTYLNGVLNSTCAQTGSILTTLDPLYIGWSDTKNYTIDEVRIYNTSLSAAQIYQDYLAGNASRSASILASNEITSGDSWKCEVTPNDGYADGNILNSTEVNIVNSPPTQSTPFITPTAPNTTSNLTCNWNGTTDVDGDPITNITVWYRNNQSFIQLYLPFEGGSNSTYTGDYSGMSHSGSVSSARWNRTGGRIGGAYVFNGSPADITLGSPSDGSLDFPLNDFSFGAWVYTPVIDTSSAIHVILGKFDYSTTIAGYSLVERYGQYRLQLGHDGTGPCDMVWYQGFNYNIVAATWEHIFVNIDRNENATLFINGQVESTVNISNNTGCYLNNSFNFLIGKREDGYYLNATIDEVQVFNRTLSQDQINQLYLAGTKPANSNILSSEEISASESWKCSVTPNDGYSDGTTLNSTPVIIGASPSLTINYPTATTIADTTPHLNMSLTQASASSLWYNLNNGTNTTLCAGCNISDTTFLHLQEGNYTLYGFANDTSGNRYSAISSFTIAMNGNYFDAFADNSSILLYQNITWFAGNVSIVPSAFDYLNDSNLVSLYQFNIANNLGYDIKNRNHLNDTVIGTPLQNDSLPSYYSGKSVSMDGASGTCRSSTSLDPSINHTTCFWAKVRVFGINYDIFAQNCMYDTWTTGPGSTYRWTINNCATNEDFDVTNAFSVGSWTFICNLYNQSAKFRTVVLNGNTSNKYTHQDTNPIAQSANPWCIGSCGAGCYFNGTIFSPMFFNRTLTDVEIRSLYNNGYQTVGNFTSDPINTTANITRITSISWSTLTANPAANASVQVSLDGGANWYTAINNSPPVYMSVGRSLVYRVFYNSTSPLAITNMNISWSSSEYVSVSTPSLSPATATKATNLSCSATAAHSGTGNLSVQWFWYNGTTQVSNGTTVVQNNVYTLITTLDKVNLTRNDIWNCTVRANDSAISSDYASAIVTISNAPPTQLTPYITPLAPNITSNLTCSYNGTTDADSDPVVNITAWYLNNKSYMLLYYPFEGGSSSSSTKDYSGLGYDGTVLGPQWNRTGGKVGGAYRFNRTRSDYIDTQVITSANHSLTYTCWFNTTDVTNTEDLIGDQNVQAPGDVQGCTLRISGGLLTANCANGTQYSVVPGIATTANVWHFAALVYNYSASNLSVYQDGASSSLRMYGFTPRGTASDLEIGRQFYDNYYFNGTIDEVKIYNYSLSADQLYQEYLAGNVSRSANFLADDQLNATDNWKCEVTPNDGFADGNTLNSTSVTIASGINTPPTQDAPSITPTNPTTASDLTCNYNNVQDIDNDPVVNITRWFVNDLGILRIYLPFEGGSSDTSTPDYSGYSNNANVSGASFTRTGGKVGGGYQFDMSNESITVAYSQSLNLNDSITLALWYNITPNPVLTYSLGSNYGCAVLSDHSLQCWGRNNYGQLGDGTLVDRPYPVPVRGNYSWSNVSLDYLTTCGILVNGSVLCWGYNAYGSMGDGTATSKSIPTSIIGTYNATQISVGYYHTCALLVNGSAICWGRNNYAQNGDGTAAQRTSPVLVNSTLNFTAISLGNYHTCGIVTNGSMVCWGRNNYGQLGDGTNVQNNYTHPVNTTAAFIGVSGGDQHTCAVLFNGSVSCWGYNAYGQLGDASIVSKYNPVITRSTGNFTLVSSGWNHGCSLLINGSVMCWGDDTYSQLGDGNFTQRTSPVFVNSSQNYTSIVCHEYGCCGLQLNGSLMCWGDNDYGELGDGTSQLRTWPAYVAPAFSFQSVAPGAVHTCGLLTNGTIVCWGYGPNGQLGDNSMLIRNNPVLISSSAQFLSVASGYAHSCGILLNRSAMCWGYNTYATIGDGTTTVRLIPTIVNTTENFTQISAGYYHTCGLLANGSALCWGRNNYGQNGDGTNTQRANPLYVNSTLNLTKLANGLYHTCAIVTNGSIVCWGRNNYGQLGDGSTVQWNITHQINSSLNFTDVTAGDYFSCGLVTNGSVMCWGYNNNGQLGDSSTTQRNNPVQITGGYNFTSISAGSNFACALYSNGSMRCTGDNLYGKLGIGNVTDQNTMQAAKGVYNFTRVYGGTDHACAIEPTGNLLCWGRNKNDQLGFDSLKLSPSKAIRSFLAGQSPISYGIGIGYTNETFAFINYERLEGYAGSGWHHAALTYDSADAARLYIDGSLSASETIGTKIMQTSESTAIFAPVLGMFDEFSLYARAISADQLNRDYLAGSSSRSANQLSTQETISIGESWKCQVTPNDGYVDGNTLNSSSVSISNTPPTQLTPYITPNPANTSSNLTCNWNNTQDADNDAVQNITAWYKNNQSQMMLYMPFEGGSNSTYTKDYSGKGNSGNVSGATWNRTGGKIGSAYTFNGSGSHIRLPAIGFNRNNGSIEGWVKFQGTPAYQYMIGRAYDSVALGVVDDGGFRALFRINNSWCADYESVLTPGAWYHLVGTFDGSTQRLYINGILAETFAYNGNWTNQTSKWAIGAEDGDSPSEGRYFNGTIDEVRLYNYTLTSEQILAQYQAGLAGKTNNILVSNMLEADDSWKCEVTPNDGYSDGTTLNSSEVTISNSPPTQLTPYITPNPANISSNLTCNWNSTYDADSDPVTNITVWYKNNQSSLLLYLPFEGGSNTTYTKDYSGYANTAVAVNVSWTNTGGHIGGGYNFSNETQLITVADNDRLNLHGPASLELWAKSDLEYPGHNSTDFYRRNFVSKAQSGQFDNIAYVFYWYGTNESSHIVVLISNGTNGNTLDSDIGPLNTSRWYHLAATWNETAVMLFVNGQLNKTIPQTVQVQNVSTVVRIGGCTFSLCANNRAWDGQLDEIKIYNHSLSADQIWQNFIAGNASLSANIWTNDEMAFNQTWKCSVTPNDGYSDGTTLNSSEVYINSTVAVNAAPNISIPIIRPLNANISADLTCNATPTDAENTSLTVEYFWYNGTNLKYSGNKTGVQNNTNTNITTLGKNNLTRGAVWNCTVRSFDGTLYSNFTSSTRTIGNTPPPQVNLSYPADLDTTFTNRTPRFNWTAVTDVDGDSVSYHIEVSMTSTFTDQTVNVTSLTNNNYTKTTDLAFTTYWWRVRATDGTDYGNFSMVRNFTLVTSPSITILTSAVNFGSMQIGSVDDTTDNSPPPFAVENTGNIELNISINATALWTSSYAPMNTSYYQYKANASTEQNSFNYAASATTWQNMSAVWRPMIVRLNHTDTNDIAGIDIRIQAPLDEPAVLKNSSVLFYAEETV